MECSSHLIIRAFFTYNLEMDLLQFYYSLVLKLHCHCIIHRKENEQPPDGNPNDADVNHNQGRAGIAGTEPNETDGQQRNNLGM